MSIRKALIKLNNKLESSWQVVNFSQRPVVLNAGWYVAEFTVPGSLNHIPRLVVKNQDGREQERALIGVHAGRNRMLFYLPEGELIAHSDSIEFERLARVSNLEARFRTLLICARYLRDFFGFRALFKMLALQFQAPFERSTSVLHFYSPDVSERAYLQNIDGWKRFNGFSKKILNLFGGKVKIAVLIEHPSQREALENLLIAPDWIIELDWLEQKGKHANALIAEQVDYVLPLQRTETLRSPAILMLKRALKKAKKRPNLVYTDHDYRWPKGHAKRSEPPMAPVFKPQPSKPYLCCFNYVGPAVMFASSALEGYSMDRLLSDPGAYHCALACFSNPDDVLHLSEALFCSERDQVPATPVPKMRQSFWQNIEWQQRQGHNALVATDAVNTGPAVDLVIPTRDGLAFLKPCVDGILAKTEYQNFHIIIVDNGSEQAETFDYFKQLEQDPRVSVVSYPGEFNYSAINNFAASHGNAPYIGLINNDIEVIKGDWLTQMMAWAVQPEVGIVGAKLLFGDGRVQHAGVTIGMGNAAGHIHRLEAGDAPGYQHRCLATQNMMAVTAACLITPRPLFESMGGLNEQEFKVAYNDIDYCLRVEKSGQQVIWTPEAVLYHHESVSRGDDMSDKHIERYFRELQALQSRWKTKGFVDKYYSRHLRISDEGVFPQVERESDDQLNYFT